MVKCIIKLVLHTVYVYDTCKEFLYRGNTSRVKNKEIKVHGQMAKYFSKCLAIRIYSGHFVILYNK